MKKLMRKRLNIMALIALSMVMIFSNVVFAAEIMNECESDCAHIHNNVEGQQIEWEKEVVIEVNSEEEFLQYPKNPNYRYTFIIKSPSLTRAVCYVCGRPTMGTITRKEQSTTYPVECPMDMSGVDAFMSWNNYTRERCTGCGYQSEEWLSQVTYTAQCLNGFQNWDGEDWIVKYEYTQSAGYNLHQSLRWWTEKSII